VFRARDRATAKIVALKQIRLSIEDRQNGIPITALREISILRSLKHENIVNVLDVAVGNEALDEIYMVMEYAEQVGVHRSP
jgi:cyclin-dependent kinase 10